MCLQLTAECSTIINVTESLCSMVLASIKGQQQGFIYERMWPLSDPSSLKSVLGVPFGVLTLLVSATGRADTCINLQ